MSTILLLEPDVLLARNTITTLKNSGHKISWHRDAQSAIGKVDKNMPDLIIVELQLTAHSGVEFLYELRSYSEWQTIPIVIYSHIPNTDTKLDNWRQFNVVAYHYKPHTKLSDLLRSVDQILAAV